MRQFSHKIAKSKLEKLHLSATQIAKVYSYKSKAKQQKVASQIARGVKLAISNKFLKLGFAESVLLKQQQKLYEFSRTDAFAKLSNKEQRKLEKKYWLIEDRIIRAKIHKAKTKQTKIDLIEARRDRLDRLRTKLNAGDKAYYINKSRKQSYEDNGTINQSKLEFVVSHYPTEYQKRVDQGIPIDQIVEELWEQAIKVGDVKELAQGVGYGYIDDTYKEVISPV